MTVFPCRYAPNTEADAERDREVALGVGREGDLLLDVEPGLRGVRLAHRQFDQLAALGARNVGHDKNLRRNMARRGVLTDR